MLNKKVFRHLLLLIFFVLLLTGYLQSKVKPYFDIELKEGTIRFIDAKTYEVSYKGKTEILTGVDSFVIYEGVPYFNVVDERSTKILRWTEVIATESFSLMQVWDKLYFFTLTSEEPNSVTNDTSYLNIIDKTGRLTRIKLKFKDNIKEQPEIVITEDYCVLSDRLFIDESDYEFCVSDKNKKELIKCYDWPDVKRR